MVLELWFAWEAVSPWGSAIWRVEQGEAHKLPQQLRRMFPEQPLLMGRLQRGATPIPGNWEQTPGLEFYAVKITCWRFQVCCWFTFHGMTLSSAGGCQPTQVSLLCVGLDEIPLSASSFPTLWSFCIPVLGWRYCRGFWGGSQWAPRVWHDCSWQCLSFAGAQLVTGSVKSDGESLGVVMWFW